MNMKKIILATSLFLILIPVHIFCSIWFNYVPAAFIPSTSPANPTNPGENPDTKSITPAPTLDELTIQGAAYFLKSSSCCTLFLQGYEQNSSDIDGLKPLLTEAISNLEKSTAIYSTLIETASHTPYNPAVLYRLSIFDYDGFRKEKGLYPDVFKKVSYLLRTGNITGAFETIHAKSSLLLKRLYTVKYELNNGLDPDVWKLWEINQGYIDLTLFGQYASMVVKDALKL